MVHLAGGIFGVLDGWRAFPGRAPSGNLPELADVDPESLEDGWLWVISLATDVRDQWITRRGPGAQGASDRFGERSSYDVWDKLGAFLRPPAHPEIRTNLERALESGPLGGVAPSPAASSVR